MLVTIGIALMVIAVLAAVCSSILLSNAKKKMEKQFELEYGKKRHT